MNYQQHNRFIGLLAALEAAAVAKSWAGSQPPADRAAIDTEYLLARAAVELFVDNLERSRARLSRILNPDTTGQ